MVLKRERTNPRFGFLLPWSPLHPVYRARAAAALSPARFSELFSEAAVAGNTGAMPALQAAEAGVSHGQLLPQPSSAAAEQESEQSAEGMTAAALPDDAALRGDRTGKAARDGALPREPSAAQQQADLDAFSAAVAEIDDADTVPPGTEAQPASADASAGEDAAAAVAGKQPDAEDVEARAHAPVSGSSVGAAAAESGQRQAAENATASAVPKLAGLAANPPVVAGLRVRRAWDQRPEDLQPATGAGRRARVVTKPLHDANWATQTLRDSPVLAALLLASALVMLLKW